MTSAQAYSDGYDAYLLFRSQSSGVREQSREIEPHGPYVDDLVLYRAWLEGWEDAAGRCSHVSSDLAEAIVGPPPPGVIPGFAAVWPTPTGTATALQCRLRCGP